MVYYLMGKTSRKKRPSHQPGKSEKADFGKRTAVKTVEQPPPRTVPTGRKEPQTGLFGKKTAHLVLIGIIGLLVYSNTFHVPFQWDGEDFILGNPAVTDLTYYTQPWKAEGLLDNAVKTRFIGYLTFALNYRFHGFEVVGFHIVNLAIHIANALLVYFLVLFTFRTPYFKEVRSEESGVRSPNKEIYSLPLTPYPSRLIAFAVALLFVAHPLQTEAVTYIFQRLASLVTMFYLLSLVLYIKGRLTGWQADKLASSKTDIPASQQAGKLASYFLSLVFAVLAMKTKENAFTLPVMIGLYEFLFFSGPLKLRIWRLVPFMLTMLIIPLLFLESGFSAGEIISQVRAAGPQSLSRIEYLFTQFRVIVTYIRLLIVPVNQNLVYDYPVYRSFFSPAVIASFVFLVVLFGTAVYLLYKSRREVGGWRSEDRGFSLEPRTSSLYRLIAFGILWFFITLSVESSIIPIPMVIDEYRVYLPSVGFFMAVVAGGFSLIKKYLPSAQKQRAAIVAAGAIIIILASATYARNGVWSDKISLWKDVVSKSPGSWKGLNNLGKAYNEKGFHENAAEAYKRALAINPSYPPLYANLGAAYAGIGQRELAVDNFMKAIALNPYDGAAHANLARAYAEEGRIEEAAAHYKKAAQINPYNSTAYHGLGTAYSILGRLDNALAAYKKFVELSPKNPEAYRSRGFVYAQKGDTTKARADFEKACALGDRKSCGYLKNYR